MRARLHIEKFKVKATKQVTERGHLVAEMTRYACW